MSSNVPVGQTGERIVVGVDGSAASIDALRWGARQASLTDATLEAVIAWQYPMSSGDYLLGVVADWEDNARTALDQAIDKAQLHDGLPTSSRVIEGHPAQVLAQAAADADLLVVGSRGHGGFAGMLLGSVSEHVCAHASCPVLVLRHIERP